MHMRLPCRPPSAANISSSVPVSPNAATRCSPKYSGHQPPRLQKRRREKAPRLPESPQITCLLRHHISPVSLFPLARAERTVRFFFFRDTATTEIYSLSLTRLAL